MKSLLLLALALFACNPVANPVFGCKVSSSPPRFLDLQCPSGMWDADAPNPGAPGWQRGTAGDDLYVSSLIVLGWVAQGRARTTDAGQVGQRQALAWIASRAGKGGWLGERGTTHSMRDHALATTTLNEAIHLEREQREDRDDIGLAKLCATGAHLKVARRAVLAIQKAERFEGGWSATGRATDPLDPMATFWSAMALRSALDNQLIEAAPELDRAADWFRRHAESGTCTVRAEGMDLAKATLVGLMVRSLTGEKLGARLGPEGLDRTLCSLIKTCPTWEADPARVFLTQLVCMRLESDAWKAWDLCMRARAKPLLGHGFAPVGTAPAATGTLASSAYGDLLLTVYFRYDTLVGVRELPAAALPDPAAPEAARED